MIFDFTLIRYQVLLTSLQQAGYAFITFEEYCSGNLPERFVMLRHDVDLKAGNSLATSRIEQALGIRGSYYFRVVRQSNRPEIIRKIAELGHEIGYHYEDLALSRGDFQAAIRHFETQLNHFRQFYPVKTICMHGSPASKFDNRLLWTKYNYRDYGIIGEPYFDIDFNDVFYLTDTGRMWDGERFSVRDRVVNPDFHAHRYHSTNDIIKAAGEGQLPGKIMITVHPQRWSNHPMAWVQEWVMQNVKNQVKRFVRR